MEQNFMTVLFLISAHLCMDIKEEDKIQFKSILKSIDSDCKRDYDQIKDTNKLFDYLVDWNQRIFQISKKRFEGDKLWSESFVMKSLRELSTLLTQENISIDLDESQLTEQSLSLKSQQMCLEMQLIIRLNKKILDIQTTKQNLVYTNFIDDTLQIHSHDYLIRYVDRQRHNLIEQIKLTYSYFSENNVVIKQTKELIQNLDQSYLTIDQYLIYSQNQEYEELIHQNQPELNQQLTNEKILTIELNREEKDHQFLIEKQYYSEILSIVYRLENYRNFVPIPQEKIFYQIYTNLLFSFPLQQNYSSLSSQINDGCVEYFQNEFVQFLKHYAKLQAFLILMSHTKNPISFLNQISLKNSYQIVEIEYDLYVRECKVPSKDISYDTFPDQYSHRQDFLQQGKQHYFGFRENQLKELKHQVKDSINDRIVQKELQELFPYDQLLEQMETAAYEKKAGEFYSYEVVKNLVNKNIEEMVHNYSYEKDDNLVLNFYVRIELAFIEENDHLLQYSFLRPLFHSLETQHKDGRIPLEHDFLIMQYLYNQKQLYSTRESREIFSNKLEKSRSYYVYLDDSVYERVHDSIIQLSLFFDSDLLLYQTMKKREAFQNSYGQKGKKKFTKIMETFDSKYNEQIKKYLDFLKESRKRILL